MSKAAKDVNVTALDQKMISDFSKRHMKLQEVNSELKAYQDIKEKVNDCSEELEMEFTDGTEEVNVKFGDSFLVTSVDEAKTMCEEKQAEMDDEIKKLLVNQKKYGEESNELKKKLVQKFGDQIRLDE